MKKYWIYDCFKIVWLEFRNTCIPRKKPIIIPQDACIGMAVRARTIAICKGGILSKININSNYNFQKSQNLKKLMFRIRQHPLAH